MAVAEFNADGTVDNSFGTSNDGIASASFGSSDQATAYGMAIDPTSGTVVLAGSDVNPGNNTEQPAIAAFSKTGSLEWHDDLDALVSIPSEDSLGGAFRAVAIDSSGRLLAAGVVAMDDSTTGQFLDFRVVVARFIAGSSSVSIDTSFGSGGYYLSPTLIAGGNANGSDTAYGITIDPSNGDVVVVGATPTSACSDAFALALTSSGALDTSFGSGGDFLYGIGSGTNCSNVTANAVLAETSSVAPTLLLAGGATAQNAKTSSGQAVLIGLSGTGALDASFGSGGVAEAPSGTGNLVQANALAYVPSSPTNSTPSSLVASGLAYTTSGSTLSTAIGVSRYELNGTLDTSFGRGGTSTVLSCSLIQECGGGVVLQPDANIDVAGGVGNLLSVGQLVQRAISVGTAPTVNVSGSTAANAQFTIVYNGPALASGESVSVAYTTSQGTAVAGTNFQSTSGTATFTGGSATSVVVAVPVLVPSGATGAVTFTLDLSNPVGAGIGLSSGTATIQYPAATFSITATATGSSTSSVMTTTKAGGPTSASTSMPTRPVAGKGYWTVSSRGVVTSFGDAPNLGSVSAKSLSGTITSIAATANGEGFWLVSSTGHVYAFGTAHNYGSVAKRKLAGKVIALRTTAGDRGYWLASSRGAVYRFGNAKPYGSITAHELSGTVVGFASLSSGKGYWLVSSTGRVYAFGAAHAFTSKNKVSGRVTAFAAMSTAKGYWLVNRAGTVYAYGAAHEFAASGLTKTTAKKKTTTRKRKASTKISTSAKVVSMVSGASRRRARHTTRAPKFDGPIVAMTVTPNNAGYWLVSSKGTVYSFGDAAAYGSSTAGVVGVAAT